jgi:enamine deaminase RidA (YjgF/YER057c/UK114 family)
MTEQAVNHDHRVAHHPESGKRIFQLKGFEEAWGYAASVRVGNTIHVSGTVSIDDEGNPLAADDMEGQVRNAYRDIARALAAHGATMSHVVREALMTTDMARFLKEGAQARAEAYAGHALPASAPWIEVQALAHPAFLFEVEVMAMLPGAPG